MRPISCCGRCVHAAEVFPGMLCRIDRLNAHEQLLLAQERVQESAEAGSLQADTLDALPVDDQYEGFSDHAEF